MRHSRPLRRPARVSILLTVMVFMASVMPALPTVAVGVPLPTPTTWYVDASATTTGTGSAVDPFRAITSALEVVAEGQSVEVAPGTYGAYEDFPLEINGGWYDIYSTDGPADTIIDGDGAVGPLVYGYEAGFSFTGFTITGATRSEIEPDMRLGGGGMALLDCEAELSDLVIEDNISIEGAGLYIGNSAVLLADSVVRGNGMNSTDPVRLGEIAAIEFPVSDGTSWGGGISVWGSEMQIFGCDISGNMADWAGAGIDVYDTALIVFDSVISDNVLTDTSDIDPSSFDSWSDAGIAKTMNEFDGGGVSGYESFLVFVDTEFSSNVGRYGAIAASYSELVLYGSTIKDHEGFAAVGFEGVVDGDLLSPTEDGEAHDRARPDFSVEELDVRAVWDGSVSAAELFPFDGTYFDIYKTLFTGNTVETNLYQSGGALWMENSMMVGNDISFPTIGLFDTYADINFSTLADNGSLWGLWSMGEMADVQLLGSIVWDGGVDYEIDVEEYSPSITYDGWLGLLYNDLVSEPERMLEPDRVEPAFDFLDMGNISEDPRFMDAGAADYRLAYGSPCVDAVDFSEPQGEPMLPDEDFVGNSRPEDGDEDGEALWDMGALEYIPGGRLGGLDRYETAIQVVEQNFDTADTVVIATGERFPDGLSASALCGVYDAPLLLTPKTYLHPAVIDEIDRLGAESAIIIGSTDAVSGAVAAALEDLGLDVDRIGGEDRYETAALIAERVIDETEFDGTVFVARGDQFADALAVAPVAYANQTPILLVHPHRLPEATVDVLYSYGITSAAVLGGDAAVDTRVEGGIQLSLGVTTERIGGADRYETAALISEWAYDNGMADFGIVGMATGTNFPDALCGGPGIGIRGGVLLLTTPDALSDAAADALGDHSGEVTAVQYFGRSVALSDEVRESVDAILNPAP